MLNAERATRGSMRAFLLYEDLIADWRKQLSRVEQVAALPLLTGLDESTLAAVDEFVDPGLRRSASGWADVDVPMTVQHLAEQVWDELLAFTQADDGRAPVREDRLDKLSREYDRLYSEAEAIADSSVIHAARAAASAPPVALRKRPLFARLKRRLPPRLRARLGHVKRTVTRRPAT
jgi:hypothetical protein